MSNSLIQKVFLMPDGLKQTNLLVIKLKHPRTNSVALCAVDSSNKLYEIVHYGEDIASWFIDQSVSDDGSLYILTIADPLFFILSYAKQQPGKFCPIEDLLMDENYPDTHYLSKCCSEEELKNIFDSKESAGYTVVSFNKKKTLYWLQQKAKKLAKRLASNDIDLSDGSKAASLKADVSKSEEQCLHYSCHLVSEYLSDELSEDLFSVLGLQKTVTKEKENTSEEKSKKQNTALKPEDDYSAQFNMNALQEKQKKEINCCTETTNESRQNWNEKYFIFLQKEVTH